MKKLLAFMLSLTMILSLTACGEKTVDDLSYMQENGKIKIGFTYFEPMNYIDENGNFTGFETEFASLVCEKLGLQPEFTEINWESKLIALNSMDVDCLWNGLTKTKELEEAISFSKPYLRNYQVVVIRSENSDIYKSTEDLKGKNIEAESGSAGEKAVMEDENLKTGNYTSVLKQTSALMELKAGACDACVLDFVLADSIVGKGNYSDLAVIPDLRLSVEEYSVGLRKGSSSEGKINEAIEELRIEGKLKELAEKYNLSSLLIEE